MLRLTQRLWAESTNRSGNKKNASVAAGVPQWAKNPYMVKFAHFYHTLPMGVREFALIGPAMIVFCILVWRSDMFSPVSTAVIPPPTPTNFEGYTLEPIYNEKGALSGYRRVKQHHGQPPPS